MRSKNRKYISYGGNSGNNVIANIAARTAGHLLADRIINGRYSRRNKRTVYVKDADRLTSKNLTKRSLTKYRKKNELHFVDKLLLALLGITVAYSGYNYYNKIDKIFVIGDKNIGKESKNFNGDNYFFSMEKLVEDNGQIKLMIYIEYYSGRVNDPIPIYDKVNISGTNRSYGEYLLGAGTGSEIVRFKSCDYDEIVKFITN